MSKNIFAVQSYTCPVCESDFDGKVAVMNEGNDAFHRISFRQYMEIFEAVNCCPICAAPLDYEDLI